MMNTLDLYEKKVINDEEFPIQVFRNQMWKKGQIFSDHWHEHIELHYVLEGTCSIRVGGRPRAGKAGDLIVINSNELHSGYSESKRMNTLVVIFELDAFSRELANQNYIFQDLITSDGTIRELLEHLCEENEDKKPGYRITVKGLLLQLIGYLVRHYTVEQLSDKESSKRRKNLERLNTVLQYIENNYSEPITNEQLSEMVHLSEDRFNHLFKESMEMSPLNYINDIRLKKACNLLKKDDYTISEIAIAVGFKDFNHFGRLFRRKYGMPPSKIREKSSTV